MLLRVGMLVSLAMLLISSKGCSSYRFKEVRVYDRDRECWLDVNDDSCIDATDPKLIEYGTIPIWEIVDLYENYECRLKNRDSD